MNRLIIAVDPGASGGVVELWPNREPIAQAMPDECELRDYFEALHGASSGWCEPVAYVEQVGGFIKGNPAPGSAMFSFGDGYGYIRGLLAALRVKTVLVRPQTWQKGIPGVQGAKGPERKRALKEHAARLYPQLKVTNAVADALLIADYARKQEAAQ